MVIDGKEFKSKKEIREYMKKKRSSLTIERIMVYSTHITKNLLELEEYKNADVVLSYTSFSSEVNTHFLINHAIMNNKKIAVPKTLEGRGMEFYYISSLDDLKPGNYGIMEPDLSAEQVVLEKDKKYIILLPGIAFDETRNRLGYGGGYYDRFLEKYADYNIYKVMLAYELEKVDELPKEEYDIPSDLIITEVNIY